MNLYNELTSQPYTYLLVDNKADTSAHRQVISDVFGTCVSYNITNETPPVVDSTKDVEVNSVTYTEQSTLQTIEKSPLKTSADYISKLLRRDDERGPLMVQLNEEDWFSVQELFKYVECGGNLPLGWTLWRIYWINKTDVYIPVLIKRCDSEETKCFRVQKDWIYSYYQQFRNAM